MLNAITKRCRRCYQIKPDSEFASCSDHRDGKQAWCRKCQSDYHAEWRSNGGRRKQVKASSKMRKAYRLVFLALEAGDLVRPESCETPGCSGTDLHGHHDDYDKPTTVRWLCTSCHRAWHHENGPGANRE